MLPVVQFRVPKNQEDNSWNGEQKYHQRYGDTKAEFASHSFTLSIILDLAESDMLNHIVAGEIWQV